MVKAMEIPKGFKKTEIGIIPSDWEVKKIKEIALLQRGFDLTSTNLISGIYPVVYSNGIVNYHDKYRVKGPGVVTGRSGTIGNVHYIKDDYWPHNTSLWVTDFKGNYPVYIYYLYSNIKFNRFSSGSGVPTLNRNDLHDFKVPFPPTKAEQTAIAIALNDADALITQLEKLIAKKKAIKQGAMQELLKPKEGWEVKKLGEVLNLQGGYAFKSDLFVKIGIPIIRISDVKNDKVDTSESVCYEPFNIPNDFVVKKGDVLIAMSGATTGKIGVYESDKIAYLNQRVGKFVIKDSSRTDIGYISHLVRSEKFKESLFKEIAQGAQPNISGKQIESLELPIPFEKSIQTAIAQILSDMDAEIETLEKKLDKYKMLKQGMMQNLLTGKIRLI